MTDYMLPFTSKVDLQSGTITDAAMILSRRLADMRGLYADGNAEAELAATNPLIYEVFYGANNPQVEGQLEYCTTVL